MNNCDITISGGKGKHEYVDLGLPSGTLWATYNVGATKPSEYGNYFAWGETKPKTIYDWETYKWCKGSDDSMSKYCTSNNYGLVDDKTFLEAEDDTAITNWGKEWRMPTFEELQEMLNGCIWKWVKDFNGTGVAGQLGTSKTNSATIFFPAAGYLDESNHLCGDEGYYWSSSLHKSYSDGAYCLDFGSEYINLYDDSRSYGRSVRAVVRLS
ncbi:MAG: hypothetical protein KBT32_03345 [Bacteroidales bacterium]|nr:hypothetical protein [Candidatus Physcocola equi]